MVHKKVSKDDPDADGALAPAYTQRLDLEPIPKFRMPDDGAPADQIKAALQKVRESRKRKQADLVKAQEELRQVVTTRQEAVLVNFGTLD